MALKDWEKKYTESSTPSFIYGRKDGTLQLVGRKLRDEPNWDVFVIEPYEDLEKHIIDKKFKTQAQAHSFALQYMRTH
ncbi:hypothetical protein M0R04_09590 [Candidatus Dojkabacteria bacterium]|jgi:hypothetical protein|nr:hypothetical protein [Candidatus Dojkabacteria bacterium]